MVYVTARSLMRSSPVHCLQKGIILGSISGSCRGWWLGLHEDGAWDYTLIEGVCCRELLCRGMYMQSACLFDCRVKDGVW